MSLVRQLNWEKALLVGAIGVALWSKPVEAGEKILFSRPDVPIGAPLSEEELSKKILPRGPSMFSGPGEEILPPTASGASNNRQYRKKSASKDLFDTDTKTDEEELNIGKILEKSVSTESLLENTKDSQNSPFDRAWDGSSSSNPWKDINDSSKERNSSSSSSYGMTLDDTRRLRDSDSRNSRSTRDSRFQDSKNSREGTRDFDSSRNRHNSIALMDNSDYSTSNFKDESNQRWNNQNSSGDSMFDRTSTSTSTQKELLAQKSLQQDYTKMFNEMADSTSPLRSNEQDMTNSIHDSIWQLQNTGSLLPMSDGSPYSLTPHSAVADSPFSMFGQSSASTMKGSSFDMKSLWGNETSSDNFLLQSSPVSTPEQKKTEEQPTILTMPKRPGQL